MTMRALAELTLYMSFGAAVVTIAVGVGLLVARLQGLEIVW